MTPKMLISEAVRDDFLEEAIPKLSFKWDLASQSSYKLNIGI